MIDKFFWTLRAVLYKPFFGKFSLPSYLGKPTLILGIKRIFIDKKVRIFPHVRMETHQNGTITIQEDVIISQNVHITSASNLVIGKKSLILANVFITNIDHEYQEIGKPILEQPLKYSKTRIGDNCFIGFGASIQAGTVLGKQCIVGTNAVVRGTYPDYSVIVGVPAKAIKRYNEETGDWEKI